MLALCVDVFPGALLCLSKGISIDGQERSDGHFHKARTVGQLQVKGGGVTGTFSISSGLASP